jgi:hypothetical protein
VNVSLGGFTVSSTTVVGVGVAVTTTCGVADGVAVTTMTWGSTGPQAAISAAAAPARIRLKVVLRVRCCIEGLLFYVLDNLV